MGHEVHATGAARPRLKSVRLGHLLSIAAERLPREDTYLQRHLIAAERDFRPDVILTTDRSIQPEVVRKLKEGGAAIALWFPDHVSNMGRHDFFLAGYDRIFFKNPALVRQLTAIQGIAATYLPEACNPSWHKSDMTYGTDQSIVLAGNVHPTRAILLDRMVRAGLPLKIYGAPLPRWMNFPALESVHTGQSVQRAVKANTFRSARVVLNNLHPAEFAGVNCRLFEAAGSGAAILTEAREGLDDLFEVGKEVLTFGSFDELVEKCEFLLGNQSEGARIGDAAAYRAHADHTYDLRLVEILGSL
jgi:spore maturation protein CgeB